MIRKPTAKLRPESLFIGIFPNNEVPVRSPIAVNCQLQGIVERCFIVDEKRVSAEQLEALAERITKQCGGTREEFLAAMRAGIELPLRERETFGVGIDLRFFH